MHTRKKRPVYLLFFFPLLAAILISCAGKEPIFPLSTTPTSSCATDTGGGNESQSQSAKPANQLLVTVNASCLIGVSQYAPGMTHVDKTLIYPTNATEERAVNNVKALIKGTIKYQNTHIMGWGMPDPWPNPTDRAPTQWSALDLRMQLAVSTGSKVVISLDEAPWWMKGTLQPDGTTHPLTAAEEWASVTYSSRILDNKMDDWLKLVESVARRYMVPPYNARYFQVWNEMKGYSNPLINNYDYTDSPGNPKGPYATHGYTYMYNRVYERLMEVARSLHIPTSSVMVGGPYVFVDLWSTSNRHNASDVVGPFCALDQRSLDTIQYWMQHKVGAGFITFDSSVEDRDTGKVLTDPCLSAEVFGYITSWIRSLDPVLYPGSRTLPIWLAEWFAGPRDGQNNPAHDDAVKTCAMIKFIKAGGSVALSWGGSDDNSIDLGIYGAGGIPHPWYGTLKALTNDFAPGTPLYQVTVSDPNSVVALASDRTIVLVNKTAQKLSALVEQKPVSLGPYAVVVMNYTQK